MRVSRLLSGGLLCLLAATAPGQEKAEPAEAQPIRPPEGTIIINLPSAEVNAPRTLQFLITHRFQQPIEGSTIHTLFSFDSAADLGLGLSYVPVKNLEVGFLRNKILEDYELSAKYAFPLPSRDRLGVALRVGGTARTQSIPTVCETSPRPNGCSFADHRFSFFTQAIGAVTLFSRVRITAVPTYVSY